MSTTDPFLTLRTASGGEWRLLSSRVQQHEMPANQHLWVIGCAHGPSGAVWATSEDEAFDALADAGWSGAFRLDDSDPIDEERVARIGNNGDPHDLHDAWIERVMLGPEDDPALWRHVTSADV